MGGPAIHGSVLEIVSGISLARQFYSLTPSSPLDVYVDFGEDVTTLARLHTDLIDRHICETARGDRLPAGEEYAHKAVSQAEFFGRR